MRLEEKDYIKCKICINIYGRMGGKIDLEKIEKLRKDGQIGE